MSRMRTYIKYINATYEDQAALLDCSLAEPRVCLSGDEYHDKIHDKIEGYIQALNDLDMDSIYILPIEERMIQPDHEMFGICGFSDESEDLDECDKCGRELNIAIEAHGLVLCYDCYNKMDIGGN